ncbi:hypothetical protein BaRGS_00036477 [Batillaria attramentaria]|uniref:CWH43-like N-terminal domain-containing protein n=1 Tax=Batillaria attramentaria TaxID=370345 RepID=A0ABD0JBI3_9CAEN
MFPSCHHYSSFCFTFVQEGEREEDMALCILLLKRRVHWLPIITAVFIIGSLFISYGVSVGHGHVEPDFPYISYTAIQTPERCIFAQLINIGAFLLAANIYVRFLQQRELFRTPGHPAKDSARDHRVCIASLVVGWLSALGLSMVANFQTVVMRPPHYTGAALAFGLGMVYCWLQTSLSMRHCPWDCVTVAQFINSFILTVCLITFGVSKIIYKVSEAQGKGTKFGTLRAVYLVSTISEWLTAAAVVLFVLTFYPAFNTVTLQGPKVLLGTRGILMSVSVAGNTDKSVSVAGNTDYLCLWQGILMSVSVAGNTDKSVSVAGNTDYLRLW